MIEKTCQSGRPSQWHGDTRKVGSSALQEVFTGFQQRSLSTVVILEGWVKKKKKEKQQPLNKLTEKPNIDCT